MSESGRARSLSDQERIERHTLDLLHEPRVERARREGEKALLASLAEADAGSLARFPEVATEITLNALIGFVDGRTGEDLPRLIMRPPHRLAGQSVPGNRGLHDNPDTYYRLVPVDGRSDFVLEGELQDAPATVFELSLLTSEWHTIGNLAKADLGRGPGDRFRIHVGPAPGPPVDHFIETAADVEMLIVRETLADWARERPCRLAIENRISRGGPRDRDDEAYLEAAARRVGKWFRESIRLTADALRRPANVFPVPVIRNEHGMLITQAYSIGHFQVRRGEALVLTLDPGAADYVVAPITNLWGTTGAALARGASWNSSQAVRNADGTFSCVLSLEDPGVHNWLDPDGLERGFLFLRWAGLDPERSDRRAPGLEARVVSVRELREVLPPETAWLDDAGRLASQRAREKDHVRRYEDVDRPVRVGGVA